MTCLIIRYGGADALVIEGYNVPSGVLLHYIGSTNQSVYLQTLLSGF